jgi:hypothetical protein
MGLLEGLLKWLGAPGSVILVVSTVFALYHSRELLQWISGASIYARFLGLAIFLGVLAHSGLVPGIHLELDLSVLTDVLGAIWGLLPFGALVP